MININLKPGAKRQLEKGPAFGGVVAIVKRLATSVKEPWLALAVVLWIGALGFLGVVYLRTASQLSDLGPKLEATQNEYKRYQGFVREKRREEKVRDSILSQIGTIAAVDQDRYTWAHIMDEVAGAKPGFTWLKSMSTIPQPIDAEPDSSGALKVNLRIEGLTSDLANYTAFLRRLEDSPWLGNVMPIEAKTVIEKNRPLTAFVIQATFSRADSTHMRTVPILEPAGR